MATTLINDLNKKSGEFLTQEEREEISKIVNEVREMADYYDKLHLHNVHNDNKYFKYFNSLEDLLRYKKWITRIKEIFTNVKKRIKKNEKEQEKAELLEQNILEVMEKIVSGVDYWEDTKQIELRKYITRILLDYSLREQQNNPQIVASKNQLQKELKEKIKEGTKPSELKKIKQDGGEHNILDNIDWEKGKIYWMLGQPEELLSKVENGKLNEVIMTIIEKEEGDAAIHLKAIGVSEIKNKEIAKELREEVGIKTERLEISTKLIEKKNLQISDLQKEVQQLKAKLDTANKIIEKGDLEKKKLKIENTELKTIIAKSEQKKLKKAELYLTNKSLKRKRNDTQQKGGEKEIKLQQPLKGEESQGLITSIEVSAKHNN